MDLKQYVKEALDEVGLRVESYEVDGNKVNLKLRSRSGKQTHDIYYSFDEDGHWSRSMAYHGETGADLFGDAVSKRIRNK